MIMAYSTEDTPRLSVRNRLIVGKVGTLIRKLYATDINGSDLISGDPALNGDQQFPFRVPFSRMTQMAFGESCKTLRRTV